VDQRRIDSGRGPRGQRRATGRGSAFQATGDLATATDRRRPTVRNKERGTAARERRGGAPAVGTAATEASGEERGEGNGGRRRRRIDGGRFGGNDRRAATKTTKSWTLYPRRFAVNAGGNV
jgi:hypothetical protein